MKKPALYADGKEPDKCEDVCVDVETILSEIFVLMNITRHQTCPFGVNRAQPLVRGSPISFARTASQRWSSNVSSQLVPLYGFRLAVIAWYRKTCPLCSCPHDNRLEIIIIINNNNGVRSACSTSRYSVSWQCLENLGTQQRLKGQQRDATTAVAEAAVAFLIVMYSSRQHVYIYCVTNDGRRAD